MINFRNSEFNLPPIPKELARRVDYIIAKGVNHPKSTHFMGLRAIYDGLDEFNVFVKKFTVCSRGCHWCCQNDVIISGFEAKYIAYKKNIPINLNQKAIKNDIKACPFLDKDKSCSIYDLRPLNCRTLHTIDSSEYCKTPDVPHMLYGSAAFGYGNDIYAQAAAWIQAENKKMRLPIKDIRTWFDPNPNEEKTGRVKKLAIKIITKLTG